MIKINEFTEKIKNTCDFNIEYDKSNRIYLFNTLYPESININSFEEKITELQNGLIDILIDIKKPQEFITNVLSELNKIAIWYETEKIYNFENFQKLTPIIVNSIKNIRIITKPNYTINYINGLPSELDENSNDFLCYLVMNKSKTKNYKLKRDFEKVKLHYVLTKYFESIYSLIDFLLILDKQISNYGIEDYNQFRPIPKPTLRCTIKLSKIETANLFNVFFESGVFFFDLKSEIKQGKAKMEFINNNFNYINQHGKVANISNIIKEFGEIKTHTHIENQKKVIDSLIDKLKQIRPL